MFNPTPLEIIVKLKESFTDSSAASKPGQIRLRPKMKCGEALEKSPLIE
jgi:hypothetical protein